MEIKVKTSGRCCRYEWAVLEEVNLHAFFKAFWPFLRKSHCIQTSYAPFIKSYSNGANISHVLCDATGKEFYVNQDFTLFSEEAFNASGTWVFSDYPDNIFSGVLPRFELLDIPLLHATEPEYFGLLPEFWEFVHRQRFDLFLVTLEGERLFITWPEAGTGFWINSEIEAGDEPPF